MQRSPITPRNSKNLPFMAHSPWLKEKWEMYYKYTSFGKGPAKLNALHLSTRGACSNLIGQIKRVPSRAGIWLVQLFRGLRVGRELSD